VKKIKTKLNPSKVQFLVSIIITGLVNNDLGHFRTPALPGRSGVDNIAVPLFVNRETAMLFSLGGFWGSGEPKIVNFHMEPI